MRTCGHTVDLAADGEKGLNLALEGSHEVWIIDRMLRADGRDTPALVLKRFVRLDPARSTEDSGLGLSLVKAVAELHGADLQLEDNRPGLRVSLVFPGIV